MSWMFASLVCVLMFDLSHAACDQKYVASADVKKCLTNFATYVGQAMGSVTKVSQRYTFLCSVEGRNAMACMFPIMEKCPEHWSSIGDSMTMHTDADLEAACNQMNSSICKEAMTCLDSASDGSNKGMDPAFKPTNNMTVILTILDMACGPMKKQFNCLNAEVEEQCKHFTDQMKQAIPIKNANMPDGISYPEFDVLTAFFRTGCKGVPEDMATNKCLTGGMESAALKECMAKVETDFKTPMEIKSCGSTDARLMCMKESIANPCGKKYYDALVINGDTFLVTDLFTCDRSTSAAPVVRLSAAASLLAVVAAHLL